MKTLSSFSLHVPALASVGIFLLVAVGACGSSEASDPAPPQAGADAGPANTRDASKPPETPARDADAAADADADAGLPTNELCERRADANRGVFDKCCTTPADRAAVATNLTFVEAVRNVCNRVYGPSVPSGRMLAGPGQAACWAVLASGPTSACESWKRFEIDLSPCASAYVGAVDDGGACSHPDECKAGLTCGGYVYTGGIGITKDGTCRAPAALGGSCVGAVEPTFGGAPECQPGLYCEKGTCAARSPIDGDCSAGARCIEGAVCRASVCHAGLGVEGDACNKGSSTQCARTLGCGADNTCVTRRAAGDSCTMSSECEGSCVNGQCVAVCGSN
jgi:hypothetical protein